MSIIVNLLTRQSQVPSALSITINIIWRQLGQLDIVGLRQVFQFLVESILMVTPRASQPPRIIKRRLIDLVNILKIFLLPSLLCNPLKIREIIVQPIRLQHIPLLIMIWIIFPNSIFILQFYLILRHLIKHLVAIVIVLNVLIISIACILVGLMLQFMINAIILITIIFILEMAVLAKISLSIHFF